MSGAGAAPDAAAGAGRTIVPAGTAAGSGGSGGDGAKGGSRPVLPGQRRAGRHLRVHAVIAGWLVLALAAAAGHDWLPVARWLAVHLLLLGAVSTAVFHWSEHFATAVLHARTPDERWSDVRLAGLNLSVAAVLTGVRADLPVLAGAGALGVIAAVSAHLVVLVRMGRGALGGRLTPVAGYYRVAAVALVLGAAIGGTMATGLLGGRLHTGLELAHLHLNLLGWVGLTVLGTLFMLWPTVLGLPMAAETVPVARRVLLLAAPGLLLAGGGLLAGARWPAAAGLAGYAAGAGWAAVLFLRTAVRRAPRTGAAWMLAASVCWLLAGVATDLVLTATREPAVLLRDLEALLPVLLTGFVAQVLMGSLTHLLPVVLGGAGPGRSAAAGVLNRGWAVRTAALNTGVLLLALPLPGPADAAGALLAGGSGLAFLVLAAIVLARRAGAAGNGSDDRDGADGGRRQAVARRTPLLGAGLGVLLTVLAVLAVNSTGGTGGTADDGAAGVPGTVASGGTRTVEVTLRGMSVSPARIEVERGTALRLEVTNEDAQQHDLRIEDGPATPMLGWGESHTLELGPVTAGLDAWCTVPGHRAAGMTMRIDVTGPAAAHGGTGGEDGAGNGGEDGAAHGPAAPDLAAEHSAGWQPYPAELDAAPKGRLHRLELHVTEADVEVAPGVVQRMWTFGGTAPGPVLRGKVGDTFEITLVNDAAMGHGIDFHAGALAPDGPMRTIGPGERLVYRFTAERAGAWLYHCSTAPMLQHLGNGMYGAVVIDPPDLPAADHEYLLVSSQLYLGEPGSEEQVARMREARPDAWVFNGGAAQYTHAPLTVRAGDRARFWVVAAGPSDGTAFHVVGTVFDTVYREGAYLLRPGDPGGAQVLGLAVAQGGFAEAEFPEPGHYPFVDHDMRHAERGAAGLVEVTP
ncbi:multicopper oxidase domain-containing protein [Streptomyces sp. YIM 98790]|uniref:multicopper oxidase domain-containing protein n=1 Tax=Streptomyces sp. YIM 98790 TaxID=2689077 RepID=UPI001A9DB21E|nr:multicopper oxidase domain-containing protein [Streptomyces sp. YIM 98790]